ncbi:Flp pilus assembly pilin Flp [Bradyrhizobium japonicum]
MTNTLKNFLADERGATAIEYGLLPPASRWPSFPS